MAVASTPQVIAVNRVKTKLQEAAAGITMGGIGFAPRIAVVPNLLECTTVRVEQPSLLIADDDPALRDTLDEVFRPRGFRTFLARDGLEALHIVHHEAVHLVLLDVHMPRLTGIEALVQLRQSRAMLPCILLTAQPEEPQVRQVQAAHAVPVVRKPFSVRQILRLVFQTMERNYHWTAPKEPPAK